MKKLCALLIILATSPVCASDNQEHSPQGRYNVAKGISPVLKPINCSRSSSPLTLGSGNNSPSRKISEDDTAQQTAGAGAGSQLRIEVKPAKPSAVVRVAPIVKSAAKRAMSQSAPASESPTLSNELVETFGKLKAVVGDSPRKQSFAKSALEGIITKLVAEQKSAKSSTETLSAKTS